jgi:tryptophan synthase alpha subunit
MLGTSKITSKKLKKVSPSLVAVGFGVATPEDAAQVSKMADGVIVGSAIVKRIASPSRSRNGQTHR